MSATITELFPESGARLSSRALYSLVLVTRPEAIDWALLHIDPVIQTSEPLDAAADPLFADLWQAVGGESDTEHDARTDAEWDMVAELLRVWLDLNGLTVAQLQAQISRVVPRRASLGGAA